MAKRSGKHPSWQIYRKPTDGPQPETRAAAGDPLPAMPPTVIEEVGRPARGRRWIVAVVAVVLLGVVGGGVALSRGGDDSAGGTGRGGARAAAFTPAFTPERFAAFLGALRKRAGTTVAYELVVYDAERYAVVVPPEDESLPPQRYSFEGGELTSEGDYGAGDEADPPQPFQLSSLDPEALERLYDRGWHDAPWSVSGSSFSVRAPREPGDPWVTMYVHRASADPDAPFYAVDGNLDGTVVDADVVD